MKEMQQRLTNELNSIINQATIMIDEFEVLIKCNQNCKDFEKDR